MNRCFAASLLVALTAPLFAMGGANGRTADAALPDSIISVVDDAWSQQFFDDVAEQIVESGLPEAVVAIVISRLPYQASSLAPGFAAQLVREESLLFDRATRRGEPVNRIALESSRRLHGAVEREIELVAERASTGTARAADQSNDRATPRNSIGDLLHAKTNRASGLIRNRTGPDHAPGVSPIGIEELDRNRRVERPPGFKGESDDRADPPDESTGGAPPRNDVPVDRSSSFQ